jgi:hypothetical protein
MPLRYPVKLDRDGYRFSNLVASVNIESFGLN